MAFFEGVAVAWVAAAVAYIANEMIENRKEAKAAITKLKQAIEASEDYLRERKKGMKRKKGLERKIAKKWSKAHDAIEKISRGGSQDLPWLLKKSDVWENYDDWTDDEIKRQGLLLSFFKQQLRALETQY